MNGSPSKNQPLQLGLFGLAMINIVAIASLRDLPQMAAYGIGSIFFYMLAGLVFFFPVSLVAAELASAWPQRGGIYVWVREAFGQRWGFVAVFLQWFQNIFWFPVVLTFGAASLAFAISPADSSQHLAENKIFIVSVVIIAYWAAVFLNFRGLRGATWISIVGALCGVVIPGSILVILGGLQLFSSEPNHLMANGAQFVPDMTKPGNITFAVSVLLAFAGMEMTAAHAREVRNPSRTYPLGIGIATLVIVTVFILGALSISVALAPGQYQLQSGVTEALRVMLNKYGLESFARVIALGMAIGVFGSVNAWIVGPSKGLLVSAQDGALPRWLCHTNSRNVPTRILVIQAVLVSLICLVFALQPTVADVYFMLSVLTIQLYLVMYLMMFAAALVLRYRRAGQPHPFRVPGGIIGLWIVCGTGILASLFSIAVGFYPPSQLADTHLRPVTFITFLAVGLVISFAFPVVIYSCRRCWRVADSSTSDK